jgi:hypothetical protein
MLPSFSHLKEPGSTFNWRVIAGTNRPRKHITAVLMPISLQILIKFKAISLRKEQGLAVELVDLRTVRRRWKQHGASKRWYPTTKLHGVTI